MYSFLNNWREFTLTWLKNSHCDRCHLFLPPNVFFSFFSRVPLCPWVEFNVLLRLFVYSNVQVSGIRFFRQIWDHWRQPDVLHCLVLMVICCESYVHGIPFWDRLPSTVMPASFNRFRKFSTATHVFRPDTPLCTHTLSVSLFSQVENTQHSSQKEKPNCSE